MRPLSNFTPEGIKLIPRTSKEPQWRWGVSLKGFGFIENVRPVEDAELSVKKNRLNVF